MRTMAIIFLFIIFFSCEKENIKITDTTKQIYSEWIVYESIEGYVYFKPTSLALNSVNEIFFSAFVRKDWNSSDYSTFHYDNNTIKEIDTSLFFKDYNILEGGTYREKIRFNSELMFVEYNRKDNYPFVSNLINKQRSSPHQVDSKGNIWIASENYHFSDYDGIQMYDGKNWQVFFSGSDFWSLCFDQSGSLYASTSPDFDEPGVVMKYDSNKWDTVLICSGPAKWIPCMHFDNVNNLWCGVLSRNAIAPESGDGLYKYDGKKITHYHMGNSELPSNSVVDIAIDKYNNKWIATYSGGLTKLTTDGVWKTFNSENTPMTNLSVECVIVDNNDYVWFADDSGLTKFKE
ncbi:MAG: hypothetical protein ACOCUV_03715 [bacterium]